MKNMTSLGTQRQLPWEVIFDLKKNRCFLHKKEERVFGTGGGAICGGSFSILKIHFEGTNVTCGKVEYVWYKMKLEERRESPKRHIEDRVFTVKK